MEDIQKTAIMRALRTLDVLGVPYAAIIDGETLGTLQVRQPDAPEERPRYKRGETMKHYLDKVQNLQPGETATIEAGPFDLRVLAGHVSSAGFRLWGAGNYITQTEKGANAVTVLRLG